MVVSTLGIWFTSTHYGSHLHVYCGLYFDQSKQIVFCMGMFPMLSRTVFSVCDVINAVEQDLKMVVIRIVACRICTVYSFTTI